MRQCIAVEANWPIDRIDVEKTPTEAKNEFRRTVLANLCTKPIDIVNDFSSYVRLIRITALCRRFILNCRIPPPQRITGRLTVDNLQSMRRHWILEAQKAHYFDEMQCLMKTPPEPIHHSSKLISLTPFIDGNGILRVRGRLRNSTLTYDEMHPIILPPNHHFTRLIIDRFHDKTFHGGVQLISSLIRKQYWIVSGRNAIRYRIHKCITCYRQRAATAKQLMGSLPSSRVRPTIRPFLHTGVDYCGPIDLRASKYRGIKSYKGYIAVFICMTVKAVHVECVDGLTTDAFLAAFRRFIARRGLPSDMYSDNGTNFGKTYVRGIAHSPVPDRIMPQLSTVVCTQQRSNRFDRIEPRTFPYRQRIDVSTRTIATGDKSKSSLTMASNSTNAAIVLATLAIRLLVTTAAKTQMVQRNNKYQGRRAGAGEGRPNAVVEMGTWPNYGSSSWNGQSCSGSHSSHSNRRVQTKHNQNQPAAN